MLNPQQFPAYTASTKRSADQASTSAFRTSTRIDWKPEQSPELTKTARSGHVAAARVHRDAQAAAQAAGKVEAAEYHRGWAAHHEVTAAKYV